MYILNKKQKGWVSIKEILSERYLPLTLHNMDQTITKVNNCDIVYYTVANWILSEKNFILHWTDDEGTVLDVFMSIPVAIGDTDTGLLITVMGYKSFIIPPVGDTLHETYYGEKLGMKRSTTLTKLTQFLNNVRLLLNKQLVI